MKKMILSALAILMFSALCLGQSDETKRLINSIQGQWSLDDNNNVTYQRISETPGLSKDEIYQRAQEYFVYNYGSGKSVIQTQDKESGTLIAKGLYEDIHKAQEALVVRYINTWHIVKIEAKEGRARITLTLSVYDEKIIDMNGVAKYLDGVNISHEFPINPDGKAKNSMGKAFYYSHLRAMGTMDAIEKALKEGNTSKEGEKSDW